MSHVIEGELRVLDLNALKVSGENIGLQFNQDQKNFNWYRRYMNDYHASDAAAVRGYDPKKFGTCLHALSVPNNKHAYEIGVVEAKDGTGYALLYDNWGTQGAALEGVAGRGLCRLTEEYNAVVTERQLLAEGFETQRQRTVEGELQVVGIQR